MGLFLQTVLFPGGVEADCRRALEAAASDTEQGIQLDACRWHLFDKGPAVLLNDSCTGYDGLAESLSASLPCPVMVLYIYDDDLWGYFLWRNGAEVDRFATDPDYFEAREFPSRSGDTVAVAQCFGLEPSKIDRYLLPWTEERMDEQAYDTDSYVVGDCWQMADFMAVLGFDYDVLDPPNIEPSYTCLLPEGITSEMMTGGLSGHGPASDLEPLPNALTSFGYALKRAEELGEEITEHIRYMRCQTAIPLLTELIEAGPDQPAPYLLRAYCWQQLEGKTSGLSRKPDIDRDLTKALELEPDNIMILRARCPTTGTTSRYKRHIEDLTRLMDLDPENMDEYQTSRAYRYHWVGDQEAAKADLKALLQRKAKRTVDLAYLCAEYKL